MKGKKLKFIHVFLISLGIHVALIALVLGLFMLACSKPIIVDEHQDLYTLAIHNFLGSAGQGSNGEIPITSLIGVLETDSQGRVLFYYHEGVIEEGCGYGIMQKSQNGYVYYYPDDCVICAHDDWGYGEVSHAEWFTQEELDLFKARNDWDQPINEEKCEKRQIVDRKPKSKLSLKEKDFDQMAKVYFKERGIPYSDKSVHGYDTYFTTDNYGREMYYMRCVMRGVETGPDQYSLAIIFNPDGSCSSSSAVLLIEDMLNYGEALKAFKQANGWNTEFVADDSE